MRIDLKGIFKTTAKGRAYYYAWRGPPIGPRLRGEPGSPEFHASYVEAHEERRAPDPGRFRSLVVLYKASDQYQRLSPVTKRNWGPWLDRISDHFGELRIAQFERPEKIRPHIRQWRGLKSKTPRSADLGMQVLSATLSHAVEIGKIAANPCLGIKRLYHGKNRSEIIWTDDDIAAVKARCAPEIAHAVDLAAHTGLRISDLVRLSWSHINDDTITIATGKSRERVKATIPLYDALREVLARIPKRSTTVLTHGGGRPWTTKGLGNAFIKAKKAAGLADRDLHFHDLRGTAATRFHVAGIPHSVIAETLGWEGSHVEKIIRHYVGRSAATRAFITQLRKNRERTSGVKPDTKPSE